MHLQLGGMGWAKFKYRVIGAADSHPDPVPPLEEIAGGQEIKTQLGDHTRFEWHGVGLLEAVVGSR